MKTITKLGVYKNLSNAIMPEYQTAGSACFDLAACLSGVESVAVISHGVKRKRVIVDNKITLHSGERALVPTGLILDIPDDYSVRVHPRSGLSWKNGISLPNAEGVIDSDYTDPMFILLVNTNKSSEGTEFLIEHGDRLAQAELVYSPQYALEQIESAPVPYEDRQGGFGSTGVKS